MDDCGDDSKYPLKTCSVNDQQNYGSSLRLRLPVHRGVHSRTTNLQFVDDEEDVEEEGFEERGGVDGVKLIGKDNYDEEEEDDSEDDVDDVESDDDEEELDDGDGNVGSSRHQKKRKLNNLISKYEFAPRVPDWTDHETFVLLDVWGDLFIKRGRKSLELEEWQELAEKLLRETNVKRSEMQCRDRLDELKKKYRKEKTKLVSEGRIGISNWTFYKKIDMLMFSPLQLKTSLSCGIDSGEYVFMDPKVYLDRANGLDEMRDSPMNSEASGNEDEDEDDDGLSTKLRRGEKCSIGLVADSIEKFSEIYEKVEVSKGKQMVELENMRMDFQRQVETQRREILERARIEISKIREGDDDDDENDISTEDLSR